MGEEKKLEARESRREGGERADGDDRRRFVLKLGMFGAAAAATYAKPTVTYAGVCDGLSPISPPFTGTGTVGGSCGTGNYTVTGSYKFSVTGMTIQILELSLTGTFVSGDNFGTTTIVNRDVISGTIDQNGDFTLTTGTIKYSDTLFNPAGVTMTITDGRGNMVGAGCVLASIHLTTTGTGTGPGCPSELGNSITSNIC